MSTPAYKKRARQAAQKKAQELRKYEALVASARKTKKKEFVEYAPSKPYVRDTKEYPSLSTSNTIPGACPAKERKEYSGDYIVGIATMHKSNLVPVGRGDNPEHYAQMRRN